MTNRNRNHDTNGRDGAADVRRELTADERAALGDAFAVPEPGSPVTDADDPRLTAYALGELDGEDLAAVERWLEASGEGRELVQETRAFAGVLREELATEDAPELGARRREELDRAITRAGRSGGAVVRMWIATAAAVVVIAVSGKLVLDGLTADGRPGDPHAASAPIVQGDAGGRLAKRDADGFTAGRRAEAVDAEVLRRMSALGYLDGVPADGARASRSGSTPEVEEAPMPLSGDERRALGELGYSRGSTSAPRETSAEEIDSSFGVAMGGSGVALDDGPSSGSGAAPRRAGGHGGQYVPPGDAGGTASGGGTVAPPTNPAGSAAPGPGDITSGSAGALTGRGRPVSRQDAGQVIGLGQATGSGRAMGGGRAKVARGGGGRLGEEADLSDLEMDPALRVLPAGEPVAVSSIPPSGLVAVHTPPPAPSTRFNVSLGSMGYLGDSEDADDLRVSDRLERSATLPSDPRTSGESYTPITENPFQPLTSDRYSALSTFGVDVDTASYSNARRYLVRNQAPPPQSVRLEEFINAFDYDLPDPEAHPFSVTVEASDAPWAPQHRLVRVGLQADRMDTGIRPASNLVFLLDVSGSMSSDDKLPLLVASMKLLVDELDERDTVSVVTYASGSRVALPPTNGEDKATIRAALDALAAGGSTHASDGIQRAYALAAERFVEGGSNRVILATDGDFNVGITQEGALESFISEKARSGVFLTVLGFGTGNLKDSKAEVLADRGNGHYAYIDSLNEAHKVLVREMSATLVTVAKDVKLQVEFNPGHVKAYRLLGYENRALAAKDFRDDTKDAGEIGAGHSVTALYEVVPVGAPDLEGAVDLKYQAAPPEPEVVVDSPELLTVNLRYKLPDEDTGREFAVPFTDDERGFAESSEDMRWAASVASFGMVLRHSAHRGDTDLARIHAWASTAVGADPHGDRAEFLRLVRTAQGLPGF